MVRHQPAPADANKASHQTESSTAQKVKSDPNRSQNTSKHKRPRVRPIIEVEPQGEPTATPGANSATGTEQQRPRFTVEVSGNQLGQAMNQIVQEAQYWIKRGRYNKVRISRAGKPLLPDIPVGALLAIEAATFFWAGLLRGAIVNIASNVLFEVELINDAKEHLAAGRKCFLDGDLDEAAKEMKAALDTDERDAEAHVAYASLLKAQKDRAGALQHFQRALALDPQGEFGAEARRQLQKLGVDI